MGVLPPSNLFNRVAIIIPMFVALSGTPGTGKTTVASILKDRGHLVLELNLLIREGDLLGDYDPERDTFEVDIGKLRDSLPEIDRDEKIILEGHMAHLMPVGMAIVLRCRPSILEKRLQTRGYSDRKIRENVEAEACDVILIEALDEMDQVFEIDTSDLSPEEVADAVEEILGGETKKYLPGHIDWSEEVLDWF